MNKCKVVLRCLRPSFAPKADQLFKTVNTVSHISQFDFDNCIAVLQKARIIHVESGFIGLVVRP